MTRYRKAAKQNQQEEANKPLKRSRQSEVIEGSKANPTVHRQDQTSSQAGKILDLQRTVGNKVVGRYLNSPPASIQRDVVPASDRDKELVGTPETTRIPMPPGTAPPMPSPAESNKTSSGPTSKVIKVSKGNELGTTKGATSHSTMGSAVAPPGSMMNNAPTGAKIKPSQSKVIVGSASATQEEAGASPPSADQSQEPEEEPGD
jgi:hypothetical protein